MKFLMIKRSRLLWEQAGFTLFETLLAVAILGAIGMGIMNAVGASYRSTGIMDEQVTATNIATACLEALNEAEYAPSGNYSLESSPFNNIDIAPHYDVDFDVECSSDGENFTSAPCTGGQTLQNIHINVLHDGKLVLFMCTYKSDF